MCKYITMITFASPVQGMLLHRGLTMKISASVYSNGRENVPETIRELDRYNIDFFHIDCNDDLTVFDDIEEIRKISKTPVDLHIISPNPEKFLEGITRHAIELVTLQYEPLEKIPRIPVDIPTSFGLAITTDTSIDVFESCKEQFSFILFMATTPGMSSGVFDEKNFSKIRVFRDRFPGKLVHVDGGVNEDVSFILRNLGVHCIVSGSYLFRSEYLGNSLLKLKSDNKRMHFPIRSFMKRPGEFAVINENDLDIFKILNLITTSRMGFCLVVDDEQVLKGLLTDGDIRRALIRNADDFNKVKQVDFVNPSPFTVDEDDTVHSMLEKISQQSRNINFVPVVTAENKLVGAVSFHNLIKGEL